MVVVDDEDLDQAFRETFLAEPPAGLREMFATGDLHLLRPRDREVNGIMFSMNLCTGDFLRRLARLEEFEVRKLRHKSRSPEMLYRGFDHYHTGDGIVVRMKFEPHPSGVISSCPSLIRREGRPYIHINIDKLFTLIPMYDAHGLGAQQAVLRRNLLAKCPIAGSSDPVGFLYGRGSATREQINRLLDGRPTHRP